MENTDSAPVATNGVVDASGERRRLAAKLLD
jgi:hypothetical protein